METTDLSTEQLDNEIEALQPEKARFTVTDESSANWVLRKMANNRADLARLKAYAKKREEELQADFNSLQSRYGADLEAFAKAEADARRRKTVTLEQGTLAFRTVSPKLVIEDLETATTTARAVCPDAFIKESVERPTAYITEEVERFDPDAFIRHAQETMQGENATGEILPGLKLTEGREAFSIKFAKEASE